MSLIKFSIAGRSETFGFESSSDPINPQEKKTFRLKIAELLPDSIIPLHSCLISNNEKSLLICGESKSGKSTLANELQKSGFNIIANDFVALWQNDNSLYAGDINLANINKDKSFHKIDHIIFLDPNNSADIFISPSKHLKYLYQKSLLPLPPQITKKFINNRLFKLVRSVHICLGNRQTPERWARSVMTFLNYKKPANIGIIGAGTIGQDLANLLLEQKWLNSLAIYSPNQDKLGSVIYDLKSAKPLLKITQENSVNSIFSKSDIVVICFNQNNPANSINTTNERYKKVISHAEICKTIIAEIGSFQGTVLVITNPIDFLSWYIYKNSNLLSNQVFGIGLGLDYKRLKVITNEKLDVFGEHGDQIKIIKKNKGKYIEINDSELKSKLNSYSNKIRQFTSRTRFGPVHEVISIIKSLRKDKSTIRVSNVYKNYFLGQKIAITKGMPLYFHVNSKELEASLESTIETYREIERQLPI